MNIGYLIYPARVNRFWPAIVRVYAFNTGLTAGLGMVVSNGVIRQWIPWLYKQFFP